MRRFLYWLFRRPKTVRVRCTTCYKPTATQRHQGAEYAPIITFVCPHCGGTLFANIEDYK